MQPRDLAALRSLSDPAVHPDGDAVAFVVTSTDASTTDVLTLMDMVREQVAQRVGVDLETNIQIW